MFHLPSAMEWESHGWSNFHDFHDDSDDLDALIANGAGPHRPLRQHRLVRTLARAGGRSWLQLPQELPLRGSQLL